SAWSRVSVTQDALVAEPQRPGGARRCDVPRSGAPFDPGKAQLRESPVDDRAGGFGHVTLTPSVSGHPESELGLTAIDVAGDVVQPDHPDELAVSADRPGGLVAVGPPLRDEGDEPLGIVEPVRARHDRPTGDLRILTCGRDRVDIRALGGAEF